MKAQRTIKTTSGAKTVAKKPPCLQDVSKSGPRHIEWPESLKWIDDVSPNDDELTLYSNLAEATNIDDFHERIMAIVNRLGFSDYAFVLGECSGKERQLISNPQALKDAYSESGFYEHDFLENYRQRNLKPVFSSWLYQYAIEVPIDIDVFKTNREISELNQSFGYFDYYYTFMKSSHNSEDSMFVVSSKGLEPVRFKRRVMRSKTTLKLLCQVVDYLSISKFPSHFLDLEKEEVITITPQPLRVLSALANNDKTITQLADQLCISSVTVHHHITTARKALGTRTNIGAIKKAIKLGLITFD